MDRLHTLMQRDDVVEASLPVIGSKTRAAIIAKGVMLEQDRILSTIQDEFIKGRESMDDDHWAAWMLDSELDAIVALIKGETND